MSKLVVFGRRMCSACQELKVKLIAMGHKFEYYSLDPPDCPFDMNDPHSIAEWERTRLAMVEATTYRLLGDKQRFPVLLKVWANPCDDTNAFKHINVLAEDGTVDLSHLRVPPPQHTKCLFNHVGESNDGRKRG